MASAPTRTGASADIQNGSKPDEEVAVLTNRVVLKPSHKLTSEQRRAIAKVSQDRYGNVRKMHDKIAALKKLGTALGMFQDTTPQVKHPSPAPPSATII